MIEFEVCYVKNETSAIYFRFVEIKKIQGILISTQRGAEKMKTVCRLILYQQN